MRFQNRTVWLTLFIMALTLGCSSDDAPTKRSNGDSIFFEAIIGSWSYDTVVINGEAFAYEHTEGCERDIFQLYNEEGREFYFEEQAIIPCSNCAECAITQTGLNWVLIDDDLELFFGEQLVTTYKIILIDDESFVYERTVDANGDGTLDTVQITAIAYDPYGNFN